MLETVERYEEDLTDKVQIHRPLHVAVEVGEAIEVNPARERGGRGGSGHGKRYASSLRPMLARLKAIHWPRRAA